MHRSAFHTRAQATEPVAASFKLNAEQWLDSLSDKLPIARWPQLVETWLDSIGMVPASAGH